MAEWLIVPLQAGCMNRCYQHPGWLTDQPGGYEHGMAHLIRLT
jgi:hypothetical protein